MTPETFTLFYKAITQGLIMGFCTAALLGPVNALAVRRGIVSGFQQTIGVGAGAAVVDAIWAYVVFAGLIKVGIVGTGKIVVWCLCVVFLLYLAIPCSWKSGTTRRPWTTPRFTSRCVSW